MRILALLVVITTVTVLLLQPANARSCKQARSCTEAVKMWCDGYSRADGDNDGIPCENVCNSRKQVEAIQKEIGCNL